MVGGVAVDRGDDQRLGGAHELAPVAKELCDSGDRIGRAGGGPQRSVGDHQRERMIGVGDLLGDRGGFGHGTCETDVVVAAVAPELGRQQVRVRVCDQQDDRVHQFDMLHGRPGVLQAIARTLRPGMVGDGVWLSPRRVRGF